MNRVLQADYKRYPKRSEMPAFQKYYRKVQASNGLLRLYYKCWLWMARKINCIELSESVEIGNDVMIAPNTFVNCDIPEHSLVFGNPCIIKPREQATEGYINRKAELQ